MNQILQGDCREVLKTLPDSSVQCVVTSPPYFGLRDYKTGTWEGGNPDCEHACGGQVQDSKAPGAITTGVRPGCDASHCKKCGAVRVDKQIGLESTPKEYVDRLVEVFREVQRVLRDDGTVWLNLGDSYAGSWGNYGGIDRGNGKQREITKGSKVANHAYDGLENFRPATSNKLNGIKPKDLIGIPWRVAFALQEDGWYLRSDIIWAKGCSGNYQGGNVMPESVEDRPTKAHEYLFLLSKSPHYYYDHKAIKEPAQDWGTRDRKSGSAFVDGVPGRSKQSGGQNCNFSGLGRNRRSVWVINPANYRQAHFATMPTALVEPCILAGSREGDTVLDPFGGAGTTAYVAQQLGRDAVSIELNTDYIKLQKQRIQQASFIFGKKENTETPPSIEITYADAITGECSFTYAQDEQDAEAIIDDLQWEGYLLIEQKTTKEPDEYPI